MKRANIYRLQVDYEDGTEKDIRILAVEITWVFCWIKKDEPVKSMNVELLEKNVPIIDYVKSARSRENFGATSL